MIVEIIGAAGAGKSSLAHYLQEQNTGVKLVQKLTFSRLEYYSFMLTHIPGLLNTVLRHRWQGRWLSWQEINRLLYLQAMSMRLQEMARRWPLLVLDQGPLYYLAELYEFGPIQFTSPDFSAWWQITLQEWAKTLDLVVWLDAPDQALIPRIWAHNKWHPIKECSGQAAELYLQRYRRAHQAVVSLLSIYGHTQVLPLHTHQLTIAEAADQVNQLLYREPALESPKAVSQFKPLT
jgi:adenylate kinase family enzyme